MGEVFIEIFTSPSCVNCPAAKAIVHEVADKLGNIEVEHVDIMQDAARAQEYGVMAVPTVVINGIVYGSPGEVPDASELESTLKKELEA